MKSKNYQMCVVTKFTNTFDCLFIFPMEWKGWKPFPDEPYHNSEHSFDEFLQSTFSILSFELCNWRSGQCVTKLWPADCTQTLIEVCQVTVSRYSHHPQALLLCHSDGGRGPPLSETLLFCPVGVLRSPPRWSPCRCLLTAGLYAVGHKW